MRQLLMYLQDKKFVQTIYEKKVSNFLANFFFVLSQQFNDRKILLSIIQNVFSFASYRFTNVSLNVNRENEKTFSLWDFCLQLTYKYKMKLKI